MLKDAQGNRTMLAHTLLLLAHCTPQAVLPQGIRAIATILESEAVTKTVDMVMANVAKRINPLLELVEEVADTTQGVMTEARKATNMLYSTCEDVRDEIHKVAECVKEEMQRLAEGARDKVFKATEELGAAVAGICGERGAVALEPWSSGPNDEGDWGIRLRSYAAAAALSNSLHVKCLKFCFCFAFGFEGAEVVLKFHDKKIEI